MFFCARAWLEGQVIYLHSFSGLISSIENIWSRYLDYYFLLRNNKVKREGYFKLLTNSIEACHTNYFLLAHSTNRFGIPVHKP